VPPSFGGAAWHLQEVAAEDALFTQGEPNTRLYVISSGVFLSTLETRPGVVASEVLARGDLAALEPIALDAPHTTSVTAITAGTAWWMSSTRAVRRAENDPEMAHRLARLMACRVRRAERLLSYLHSTDVLARVAWLVSELAAATGTGVIPRARHADGISQTVMAEAVGTRRETVNRALAHMERRGWLKLTKRSVVVTDRDAIERRARKAMLCDLTISAGQ
jgi:CRP/FNR family transcriptional regulator